MFKVRLANMNKLKQHWNPSIGLGDVVTILATIGTGFALWLSNHDDKIKLHETVNQHGTAIAELRSNQDKLATVTQDLTVKQATQQEQLVSHQQWLLELSKRKVTQ